MEKLKKEKLVLLCIAVFVVFMTGCGSKKQKNAEKIDSKDDFLIEGTLLTAYVGEADTVTVPAQVTEIGPNAFAGDMDNGINLVSVTIPGTVKIIDEEAFAFTNADYIYIEEGVEEIQDNAFMDAYISEIHFPASLQKIGSGILETEEGLEATIYCPKNSKIFDYFNNNMPYGDCELKEEN